MSTNLDIAMNPMNVVDDVRTVRIAKLNLGCGTDIRPSTDQVAWTNLDSSPLPGVQVVCDLTQFPWPLETSTFDEIIAYDILEHLPDTIGTMEELWRVLKPGGVVEIQLPYWNSLEMITDPTHIRFFNEYTFEFFEVDKKRFKKREYYTKARFKRESLVTKVVMFGHAFYLREGAPQNFVLWLSKRIGNVTRNLTIRLRAVKGEPGA